MLSEKRISLLTELQTSKNKASQYVRNQIRTNGRLYGGCEGRPLETALTIHLFRDFPSIKNTECDHYYEILLAYCHQFWENSHQRLTGTLADIDTLLSNLLMSRVCEDQPAESLVFQRVPESFNTFTHPSNTRKRILFSILLAEMGIIPFQSLDFNLESFSSESFHLFASLIMTAAKILYAIGREHLSAITSEDVDFLLKNQSSDGGWENHVLLTLVTLMALTKIGADPEPISRGVAFVIRQIRANGSVPFIVDEDTWVTCMAGFVLTKVDRLDPTLPRVAAYIASQQLPSGGWCYTEGSRTSDTDDLAICLSFLKLFDSALYAENIRKGEMHLIALQNEDGGFPAFVRGAASEVEITAKAIMALSHEGGAFDNEVARAIHWLNAVQDQNGSFRREWKLSSSYPVAQVMHALRFTRTISSSDDSIRQIRRRSVDYILGIQNSDGGWSPIPGVMQSSVLSTSYALIALCSAEIDAYPDAIIRGTEYILTHQEPSGEFISEPDSLSPRPILCDVKPLNTIYPLWAVSDLSNAIESMPPESAAR